MVMTGSNDGTPRGDPRPLVAKQQSIMPMVMGGIVLAVIAIWLFMSLESARNARQAGPMSGPQEAPLAVGPQTGLSQYDLPAFPDQRSQVAQIPVAPEARIYPPRQEPITRVVYEAPQYVPSEPVGRPYAPPPVPPAYSSPEPPKPEAPLADRILAGRIANPEVTVVQGTLISAVLETALDSSRPGQARALVTKDVMSFDGYSVLVPRGSRIFGTYQSDVTPGQKRVLIQWSRMITPDGISVNLDSPSADNLGRPGLRGKVDNHTLRRIGDALLGSVVELGGVIAGEQVGTNPIVIVPNGEVSGTVGRSATIDPTITVEQGTRVTVFVAKDIDFSLVGTS